MTSMYDVLRASKGLPVDDIFAELWGRKLSGDYTIVTYTGTLPATLSNTKAGYLHSYKIYGNTEQTGTPTPENPIVPSECGERTANLFYYSVKRCMSRETDPVGTTYDRMTDTTRTNRLVTEEPILASGYVVSWDDSEYDIYICYFDADKLYTGIYENGWIQRSPFILGNYPYASFALRKRNNSTIPIDEMENVKAMLNLGSTALPYEPYGYKLPLTSGNTPVDIHIGDDTLSTEEYIDSGTGKIYRMVDGVLTPIDPPVSFPQIPTSAGSTTISWAGSGLAPSEVELEYERRR